MLSRMSKLSALILIFLVCTPALAKNDYKYELLEEPGLYRPIFALAGGVAFTSDAGESKNFPIKNLMTDEDYTYDANNNTQTAGLYNVFLGVERPLTPTLDLELGLSFYNLGNLSATGTLTQGADAESSNRYPYKYTIHCQQFLLESKWLYHNPNRLQRVHPYLLVGLGGARNEAKNYSVDFPPFTTFSRTYANNIASSFSYDVGFGIDVDVGTHARLGLGYRFADLGNVSLGDATIDTTAVNSTLSQSNTYVNEVLAQLTFLL